MIQLEWHNSTAVVRLDHGKVNALDLELVNELASQITQIGTSGARSVVLTGSGKAFSAGIDLIRLLDGGPDYIEQLLPGLEDALAAFFSCPLPVVAAINGPAIAGGCVLACTADVRLIAKGATIGASELVVGVPFPYGALEILRWACGSRTEHLILAGKLVTDEDAVLAGFAHQVVAADDLLERAIEAAGALSRTPHDSYRMAKEQLRARVVADIRANGDTTLSEVVKIWSRPETSAGIRESLARTTGKKS
jgi:enoyl-CoA hydratase/carnithine racemase